MIKPVFVAIVVVCAVLAVASGCGSKSNTAAGPGPTKVSGPPTTTASGLQYWDIVVGTGTTAVAGNLVSVHYTGWLTSGEKFDSSVDRGAAIFVSAGRRPGDQRLGRRRGGNEGRRQAAIAHPSGTGLWSGRSGWGDSRQRDTDFRRGIAERQQVGQTIVPGTALLEHKPVR